VVVVASCALFACGAGDTTGGATTTTQAQRSGTVYTAQFSMSGDPALQRFGDVGPDGSIRYGLGVLSGETVLAGQPVTMEAEYALDYVEGSGPFRGYWTVTWTDGGLLAFSYQGSTTATGDRSTIEGELDVIGGTGAYVQVTGGGSVSAVRDGPVGSPVAYDLRLELVGLPEGPP
jgi:hypothetical protein